LLLRFSVGRATGFFFMKKTSIPLLWTSAFLVIALLLSIAIGSVFISPLEV